MMNLVRGFVNYCAGNPNVPNANPQKDNYCVVIMYRDGLYPRAAGKRVARAI